MLGVGAGWLAFGQVLDPGMCDTVGISRGCQYVQGTVRFSQGC